MTGIRILGFVALATVSVPFVRAEDPSTYRSFQLGSSLAVIVKQAHSQPSDVNLLHQKPATIQELEWRPRSPSAKDSVRQILFTFYNGQLFRMVVEYDPYNTEGVTAEDMIEAISRNYGPATRPGAEIVIPSTYSETVNVLARWEDTQYSFNLVRFSIGDSFGVIAFSKQLDALARTASVESLRLETLQAPQREADRKKKEDDENHDQQEKARLVNKPAFRP
jgi:hypothetical protein